MMEGYCYSCYDHMQFQIMGSVNNFQKYLDEYLQSGKESMKCELCDRKVKYEQQEDGKWKEVEVSK